jgi:ribosome-associated protein
MLWVDDELAVPLRELRFSYSRSGGPGGQNVNRRDTKATLHWNVRNSRGLPEDVRERFLSRFRRRVNSAGDVVITSQRFRDQGRNSADCVEKLRRMLLQVSVRPTPRRATRPTRASVARRVADKRRRSVKKRGRRARRPGEEE